MNNCRLFESNCSGFQTAYSGRTGAQAESQLLDEGCHLELSALPQGECLRTSVEGGLESVAAPSWSGWDVGL